MMDSKTQKYFTENDLISSSKVKKNYFLLIMNGSIIKMQKKEH